MSSLETSLSVAVESKMYTITLTRTPHATATARLVKTVTTVTMMMMSASVRLILRYIDFFSRMRRLAQLLKMTMKERHATIWKTIIQIMPTKAALGMRLTKGKAATEMMMMQIPTVILAMRYLPPVVTCRMLCAIMALPPMPPRRPVQMLPKPRPKASRWELQRVFVISLTTSTVISCSMSATSARAIAVGKIMPRVSPLIGGRS
mmetsp:Transcript_1732/g.4259  ORF Transcript_1732/g.4259 Transcript_1732/m.4259 type:complete len:205 (-) Transcript_1732:1333-1947(-)